LEPGAYGFRLQVTDQSTDRSAASLVRPLEVPDYAEGAVGKAIIAANVEEESDLFQAVELANLGGDAHFGKPAFAIIPFTIDSAHSEPEITWTLRRLDDLKVREERRKRMEQVRRRAREADDDETGIRIEQDPMREIEGGVAVDSGIVRRDQVVKLQASAPVDILPDKVRLVEAKGAPDYYAALLNLHGEQRKNGAYALDIRLEGSDSPKTHRVTRFDMHWPDMPYSLYDIDVAIQNMEFIVSRDELKEIRKGSREEKIANFEAFWAKRDPTPETAYNELMVEYFKRVDYAAVEFRTGAGFIPNGLKTDRAKIFIIHGPPEDMSRSFPDSGGVLETWTYSDGRTFTFEAISSLDAFHLVDGS
jgi:GWxTD domain-containing protein